MYEVLIEKFSFDRATIRVAPTGCPGINSQDVPLDSDGTPCCCCNEICKYFDSVEFSRSEYKKTLKCNFGSN